MEYWISQHCLRLFLVLPVLAIISSSFSPLASGRIIGERGRRVPLSFKETPHGGNLTFECSPSGPCVPCGYSEKNFEQYRCSETGYRIPLKCVEIKGGSKDGNVKKTQKGRAALELSSNNRTLDAAEEFVDSVKTRSLLDDSSTSEGGSQTYITYRSCIPAVNEERLSVLGFEGIVVCLFFISGSFVYFRRKRTATVTRDGAVRIPTNSRF